jgi:hypothetical protein
MEMEFSRKNYVNQGKRGRRGGGGEIDPGEYLGRWYGFLSKEGTLLFSGRLREGVEDGIGPAVPLSRTEAAEGQWWVLGGAVDE